MGTLTLERAMELEDQHRPDGPGPDPARWGALPYPLPPFLRLLDVALAHLALSRPPVFCDLGAGTGVKGLLAADRGCTAWGVEADPALVAAARELGADVRQGLAGDADVSGSDVVWVAGLYRDRAAERRLHEIVCGRMRGGAVLMAATIPDPAGPPGWRALVSEPAAWRGAWVKP
jgi:trans-aconitate methyltransferase